MDICRKLRDFGVTEDQEIIADSAEPKSIQEIYAEGFNIHGAMKGPDSIKAGYRHP
jgi:phage terminase large subunit